MNNVENTTNKQMEQLKADLEQQLEWLKQRGQELSDKYPRYKVHAQEMIQISKERQYKHKEDIFSLVTASNFQAGKSMTIKALTNSHKTSFFTLPEYLRTMVISIINAPGLTPSNQKL